MKRLLLPLLAALALPTAVNANWFGKYNSEVEAKEACDKWAEKGIKYTYEIHSNNFLLPSYEQNPYTSSATLNKKDGINRTCLHEASTRQYLGYVKTQIKEGQHFKVGEHPDGKIIKKYFRY